MLTVEKTLQVGTEQKQSNRNNLLEQIRSLREEEVNKIL